MKTALWSDLKTDDERSAFFLSGRAYETGVVCHSIQNDLAMAYHRLAEMQKELRRLDALNAELVEALEDFSSYVRDEQCATDGFVTYSNTQIHRLVFKARAALAKAKEQT